MLGWTMAAACSTTSSARFSISTKGCPPHLDRPRRGSPREPADADRRIITEARRSALAIPRSPASLPIAPLPARYCTFYLSAIMNWQAQAACSRRRRRPRNPFRRPEGQRSASGSIAAPARPAASPPSASAGTGANVFDSASRISLNLQNDGRKVMPRLGSEGSPRALEHPVADHGLGGRQGRFPGFDGWRRFHYRDRPCGWGIESGLPEARDVVVIRRAGILGVSPRCARGAGGKKPQGRPHRSSPLTAGDVTYISDHGHRAASSGSRPFGGLAGAPHDCLEIPLAVAIRLSCR